MYLLIILALTLAWEGNGVLISWNLLLRIGNNEKVYKLLLNVWDNMF
jgi:hypothetical protein